MGGPTHGVLGAITTTCTSTGSGTSCQAALAYTPSPYYYGPDSFTFKANDGELDSNVVTVSITVDGANQAQVVSNVSDSTNQNVPKTITLSAGDVDSPAGVIFSIASGPAHGTLGSITGTTCASNLDFHGYQLR